MKINTIIKFVFCILFFLAACTPGTLDFNIKYTAINGLKNGNLVVYNGKWIGVVDKVVYTDDGDYLVEVSIDKAHANLPTDTSLFFISVDPNDDEGRAIEMLHNKDGNPIKSGETITGATPIEASFRHLQDKFEKEINEFAEGLKEIWDGMLEVPDSEQLETLEKEIDRILEELGKLSESAKTKLETEIIPEILKHFEELRKKFQGEEHKEKLDDIDEKLKQISETWSKS
jgi:MlaD protein